MFTPSNETLDRLNIWFIYHPPTKAQQESYERIRDGARQLATIFVHEAPQSADLTAALRKLREAVMTVNAAIACEGK